MQLKQPVRLASDIDGLNLELEDVHRWHADCYGSYQLVSSRYRYLWERRISGMSGSLHRPWDRWCYCLSVDGWNQDLRYYVDQMVDNRVQSSTLPSTGLSQFLELYRHPVEIAKRGGNTAGNWYSPVGQLSVTPSQDSGYLRQCMGPNASMKQRQTKLQKSLPADGRHSNGYELCPLFSPTSFFIHTKQNS